MVNLFNSQVALLLTVAVAVSSGLSAAPADQSDDPYIKVGARIVDVSFAGTLARAQKGNAAAQYDLGVMYAQGQGVAQDYATAVSWFGKAADQGNAAAQSALGFMYARGQGVPQDYAAAVSWLRKAAEQGDAGAQYNLGSMYDDGSGVPQDYVQAHKWYNLAGAGATRAQLRNSAIKNRDEVAAKMQQAQIAEAQRLASEWRKK